jgi:AAHS family 4-hydroxybenzoate transporter-like MFS transporter
MSSASMALFSLGGLIGGVGGGWLFSRFGSRKTMLCMAAGALACCAALMVTPLQPAANSLPIITVSLLLLGLCVPGTQAILFVLAAQIFPTSMRASGVGLPAAFGRLGAVLSAFIGPWILASTGTRFFGFIAAMMLILFVALTLVRRHIARTANQDRSDARLNEVR